MFSCLCFFHVITTRLSSTENMEIITKMVTGPSGSDDSLHHLQHQSAKLRAIVYGVRRDSSTGKNTRHISLYMFAQYFNLVFIRTEINPLAQHAGIYCCSSLTHWGNDTFSGIPLNESSLILSAFHFLVGPDKGAFCCCGDLPTLTFLRSVKLVWRHLTQISLHPLRSHCVLAETEPPCPLSDGSPTYCYLPVFCSGTLLNNGSHVGSCGTAMSWDKTAIVHTFWAFIDKICWNVWKRWTLNGHAAHMTSIRTCS